MDSIVFIALGPAARSASLLYALSSLREEGRWDGPVHVIVEREGDLDCLSSHLRSGVTTIAVVPPDARDGGGGGGGEGGGDGGDDSDDGDETKMGTSDREGVLARKEGGTVIRFLSQNKSRHRFNRINFKLVGIH